MEDATEIMIVQISLDASQDGLLEVMRSMKTARAAQPPVCKDIVLQFNGLDDDAREVWEIPEVQEDCRRLVALGFISYLSFSSIWNDRRELTNAGLGAAEVWLCSEGRLNWSLRVTQELIDEARQVHRESNDRADTLVGPMK